MDSASETLPRLSFFVGSFAALYTTPSRRPGCLVPPTKNHGEKERNLPHPVERTVLTERPTHLFK